MQSGIELPPADELIALPADEGCRRVALALLDATIDARMRLDDPSDESALHDFRVALRRLRSWLRAFDEFLHGSVRKKARRRLRDLSRAAGESRDGEVHITWLRDAEESLRSRQRAGGEWLLRRLVDRQRDTDATLRDRLTADFGPATGSLADAIAIFTRRIDLREATSPSTLAGAVAPRVLREAAALGERLAAVQSIQDQAVAHAARLAGKRLRYLLEPIADAVSGAPALVKRLRHLQDTIGEMHDVHIMAEEVIEAAEHAAVEQTRRVATALLEGEGDEAARRERTRDPRPGLMAIAGQLRARGESAFAELRDRWLGAHSGDLTTEAGAIAARLVEVDGHATNAPAMPARRRSPAIDREVVVGVAVLPGDAPTAAPS